MSEGKVKGQADVKDLQPDRFLDWAVERSCQLRQAMTPCRIMQRELTELEMVLDDAVVNGGFVDLSDPAIQKLVAAYRASRGR